jgi:23S rRNA (guanosine2251-2'-O)-methyltransferase
MFLKKLKFQMCECTNPDCHLRFPLDPLTHSGNYCPRCGALAEPVAQIFDEHSCTPALKTGSLQLKGLLDNIRSSLNVGSIFRIADGAGLAHLYLCGITPSPDENGSIAKTALGAQNSIAWSHHRNALDLALALKAQDAKLIALECAPNACTLYDFEMNAQEAQRVVLIVGSETAGVDPALLTLCEHVLAIPMRGEKESLNAAVAFGIAAYWLTRP